MDYASLTTFTLIMLGLAALPSASVALVVARACSYGISNGIAAAAGIVAADLLFIAIAIIGVSAIAETLGAFFAILRYVAASYLIWFGYSLIRSSSEPKVLGRSAGSSSLVASFLAGFTLTLGDMKAILFYASLFPTLFDLTSLAKVDVAAIVAITILTLGGVKVCYVLVARRLVDRLYSVRHGRNVKRATGGLLMGAGAYLVAKS